MSAKGYVRRLLLNYEKMFNIEKPREYTSPLDKDDHPELDVTAELPEEMIKVYQSIIGALQWAVTLGRLDIFAAVMTLGRFRAAPRIGHLDRLKRICGYLRRNPEGTIRFRTGKPDHSKYQVSTHDWQYSTYGASTEETPKNMPTPKGKSIALTTFVDANLLHDTTTGRSATGTNHRHTLHATYDGLSHRRRNLHVRGQCKRSDKRNDTALHPFEMTRRDILPSRS
jgi:hypothetical protein